ncbi:MAG: class I SAM-dependent methyltransferase [Alphaproteobacteria bacterium]|nr:class I SAM-dependent methyltransferase [Alphaproteobacteria bacterium]
MLLATILRRLVGRGTLDIAVGAGPLRRFGSGEEPWVAVRVADRRTLWSLVLDPELRFGEAYTDGRLTIERGDIHALCDLALRNWPRGKPWGWTPWARLRSHWSCWRQRNSASQARRNVAHHYDLDGRLYELFLDSDRHYSCGYFRDPEETLEAAQRNKLELIAAKLAIDRPGRVLDIGSGWGGLALHLARATGSEVLGITLSAEQHAAASQRALQTGLADRVRFELKDYRAVEGRFDRIVSVGMFEHVGVPQYRAFFDAAARLLSDDGVMLLHSIGRTTRPSVNNPWMERYIFPGGYVPALSEVMAAIEPSGLMVADIEVLRLHYAETLRHWRARFLANRAKAQALYDERFVRMWEFYLAGCEAAFRHAGLVVFQIQLTKRADAVPLTRDYLLRVDEHDRGDERVRAA